MVGGWPDPFPEPNISDETEVSVRDTEFPVLRIQKDLHQRDQVMAKLAPMVLAAVSRVILLACSRVRSFGHAQHRSTDTPATAADQKIRLDRNHDAFNLNRIKVWRLTQIH